MATPKFIDQNSFIGELNIEFSNIVPDVQFAAFSAQFEIDTLSQVLGDKLYSDLLADLDINDEPVTQKFIDLLNGKDYRVDGNGRFISYKGLILMLNYLCYDAYVQHKETYPTPSGVAKPTVENSNRLTQGAVKNETTNKNYNKGVKYYNSVVFFVNEFEQTYFENSDYSYWTPKKMTPRHKYMIGQPFNSNFLPYQNCKSNC